MNPLVSLIIPIYNSSQYLIKCLDSAINQTLQNIEIILIDDGSTDDSPKICDQYKEKDNRVVVIHQKNAGVSSARNRGIEIATSDWLMFLDSDDWLEPKAIEIAYCQKNNCCDLVILNFVQDNAVTNGNYFKKSFLMANYRKEFIGHCRIESLEYFPKEMQVGLKMTSQCAKLYRKEIIKSHSIRFPENIRVNEDGFFNILFILYANEVLYINAPIYHVLEREDSASRSLYSLSEGIITSIQYFNELLLHLDIQQELSEFQSIDLCLKALFVIIIWCRINKRFSEHYFFCQKECKKYLSNILFTKGIKKAKIQHIKGFADKALIALLKCRLFGLAYFIVNFYYRIFR